MNEDKEKKGILNQKFHEQVVLTVGFLGGVMFAVLIFILQSNTFTQAVLNNPTVLQHAIGFSGTEYVQFVETTLGTLTGISAVACLISVRAISEEFKNPKAEKILNTFLDYCFLLVIFGFGLTTSFVLLPFTEAGSVIMVSIFLVFAFVGAILFRWARGKPLLS